MSFSSALRAILEMDISPFQSGAKRAEGVAGELGNKISRKLGAGDAFKGLLTAFTISIEGIAGKLAEAINGGSKEAWQDALKSAQDYDKQIEKTFLKTRAPGQQAEYFRTEEKNFQREADRPRQYRGLSDDNWFMRTDFGFSRTIANTFGLGKAETAAEYEKRVSENKTKASQSGEAADEAAKKQREFNAALQDELETRALIGKEEGAQILGLQKKYDQLVAEANLLRKTDVQAANAKDLEAAKNLTAQHSILVGIDKSRTATQEELDDMQRESAAQLETSTEKILRLRADAERLEKRSADNTRTVAQSDKDRIEAQKKVNEAVALEINLRKSNLSLGDVASKGAGSERSRRASQAQQLYSRADRESARGNFAYGEQLRTRARGIDDSITKQEADYLKRPVAAGPAQSEWDKKYGSQLKQRAADMDAGLALARDRAGTGKTLSQQIRESQGGTAGLTKSTPATEFKTALSATEKSLDNIDKALNQSGAN